MTTSALGLGRTDFSALNTDAASPGTFSNS